jgi:alcohol dehydrogenase
MEITGAVLEEMRSERPYASSRPLGIRTLELDPPGAREVLVRIEAAGLCHSDLSVVDGNRPRPMPMLLGHEAAGVVTAVGDEVDPALVGRRVVTVFLPRCGQCRECQTDGRLPCRKGSASNAEGTLLSGARRLRIGGRPVNHHVGVSGFATAAVVDVRSIVPVDDDVPAAVAALLGCAVLTGGGAVMNTGVAAGDRVAVVGLGGVGMAALLVARALAGDDAQVIGIDQIRDKLDAAMSLGASEVYTPGEAADAGVKADLVIEAAGHPRAFETAFGITAAGGRLVTVGLPGPDARVSIAPLDITAGARTITGSYLGSSVPERDVPVFVRLWREGRLPVERLATHRIELSDLNGALDNLADGRAIRQVIEFRGA